MGPGKCYIPIFIIQLENYCGKTAGSLSVNKKNLSSCLPLCEIVNVNAGC